MTRVFVIRRRGDSWPVDVTTDTWRTAGRFEDGPPAPTRPIAEMGMAPEDHWREDARTGVLLQREGAPFREGYVLGWWWGVCCGAVAATLTSAAAVIGWATWWH